MNDCKYFGTEECKEFLEALEASCDGEYFYDGQGHSLPTSECDVKKRTQHG